jgi:hypothetical protein
MERFMFKKHFTCLMIKTQEKKLFFTYKTNLPQIIEYVKNFKSEIYLVKAYDVEVLQLEELSLSLCNKFKNQAEVEHDVLEKIFPISIRKRVKILKDETKIREFISTKLKKGDIVSLQSLKKKYAKLNLTDSCLCSHLAKARKQLVLEGHTIKKVGPGKYQKPSLGS